VSTQLWVTLDFKAVGTITLHGGSGSMPRYNMGDFGVSSDQIRVNSALPDIPSVQQIPIGGSFVHKPARCERTMPRTYFGGPYAAPCHSRSVLDHGRAS